MIMMGWRLRQTSIHKTFAANNDKPVGICFMKSLHWATVTAAFLLLATLSPVTYATMAKADPTHRYGVFPKGKLVAQTEDVPVDGRVISTSPTRTRGCMCFNIPASKRRQLRMTGEAHDRDYPASL